jgi:perosamine synthetase
MNCKNETPETHKFSKIGLNLPTYESLKSMDEIRKALS